MFRPEIVNNIHDAAASIRGNFIFQRKSIKDDWEDHKEVDLNKLRATEWIKLELKSAEMLNLFQHLKSYYDIHEQHGIVYGETTFQPIGDQAKKILLLLEGNSDVLESLFEQDSGEIIQKALTWIATNSDADEMIRKLSTIENIDLDQLNNLIGITNLKKLTEEWEANLENESEEYWQKLFGDNAWVLSQIFSSPFILLEEKVYIGGKGLNNKGGKVVDFIYQNNITQNVSLVEIKTPLTELISTQYRQGAYSIHNNVSGSIVQVLTYKDHLQKEYTTLANNTDDPFKVFNPKCVVIIGQLSSLEQEKQQSFELFRNEMKNVEIITFDELLLKVKMILNLLSEEV